MRLSSEEGNRGGTQGVVRGQGLQVPTVKSFVPVVKIQDLVKRGGAPQLCIADMLVRACLWCATGGGQIHLGGSGWATSRD